jgi:hypothetical protein
MLRRQFNVTAPEWLLTPTWDSLRWWTQPLLDSLRPVIDGRGSQGFARPVRLLSVCSGIFSEGFAAQALGIPLGASIGCDISPLARDMMQIFHQSRLTHVFTSMEALSSPKVSGACVQRLTSHALHRRALRSVRFVAWYPDSGSDLWGLALSEPSRQSCPEFAPKLLQLGPAGVIAS